MWKRPFCPNLCLLDQTQKLPRVQSWTAPVSVCLAWAQPSHGELSQGHRQPGLGGLAGPVFCCYLLSLSSPEIKPDLVAL